MVGLSYQRPYAQMSHVSTDMLIIFRVRMLDLGLRRCRRQRRRGGHADLLLSVRCLYALWSGRTQWLICTRYWRRRPIRAAAHDSSSRSQKST